MSAATNMMQSAQGAVSSGGNKMLKLIWGKANQPTAERLKIQKELFQFQKVRETEQRDGVENDDSLTSGLSIFSLAALILHIRVRHGSELACFEESCAKIYVPPTRMQLDSSKRIQIRRCICKVESGYSDNL